MRVTEGLGPTSLRSSSFVNNTATAVLRFEGRTWVLKTDTFFAGIQFLDVLFYTQFQGASQAAYKFAELQHAQQQVRWQLMAVQQPSVAGVGVPSASVRCCPVSASRHRCQAHHIDNRKASWVLHAVSHSVPAPEHAPLTLCAACRQARTRFAVHIQHQHG